MFQSSIFRFHGSFQGNICKGLLSVLEMCFFYHCFFETGHGTFQSPTRYFLRSSNNFRRRNSLNSRLFRLKAKTVYNNYPGHPGTRISLMNSTSSHSVQFEVEENGERCFTGVGGCGDSYFAYFVGVWNL